MPKINKLNSFGYSLVELMVVVGIIAILSTVGLTIYKQANLQSRDNQRQADLKQAQAALEQYHNDLGWYPVSSPVTSVNFDSGGQISATLPPNPVTNQSVTNVYLNILPRDPQYTGGSSSHRDYLYIARPSSQLGDGPDCDNTTSNQCTDYCLVAQIEIIPSSYDTTCITGAMNNNGYNYSVRKSRN